ncbi:MAG TPA: hypothetical protein VGJ03_14500 [Acidimicrobiales bacterium]
MAGFRRVPAAVVAAAAVAVAVALQLLRQPGARSWNTVWAEDGYIYTSQAYGHGPVSTMFRGYAGYAQFVPRVIALGVRPLPVSWVAPYLAFTAAFVTALLGLFVYWAMAGWVRSPWLRSILAAMSVLAPVSFFEINANIANLGWPLLFAAFWAFVARRDRPFDIALRAAVVLLCGLTTPVLAVLVPVGIAVAVARRRAGEWVIVAAALVSLLVQWIVVHGTGAGAGAPSTLGDLPREYGVRVVGALVFGERWLGYLWAHLGVTVIAIGVAVVAVVAVVALLPAPVRLTADRWWFAIAAGLASVALFAVPVWIRGTEPMRLLSGEFTDTGSRYVYVPLLVLLSGLFVLVDGSGRRWLEAGATAHAAVLIVVCFGLAGFRSAGPTWSSQLEAARATCRSASAPAIVNVPTTPDGLDWYVAVPCGRVGSATAAR